MMNPSSATHTISSGLRPSSGNAARPTLTVIGFRLSGAITLDSTRRRKRSAKTSPSAFPVSGRMNANSSPPTRQGTSPSRDAERMRAPSARSTASPLGCPNSSLNFLKLPQNQCGNDVLIRLTDSARVSLVRLGAVPPQPACSGITIAIRSSKAPASRAVLPFREWPTTAIRAASTSLPPAPATKSTTR